MTEISAAQTKKKIRSLPSIRQLMPAFFGAFLLALLLRNAEIAMNCMTEGLRLCALTVIPSLFPSMVAAELLAGSNLCSLLGRCLKRPCRALFGVCGESGCAILLGLLCGFPVGTRFALTLYDRGIIDEGELSFLLCFCNNPSSAFLIGAVGVSLFGDRSFGVRLYLFSLITAILTGLLGGILRKKRKESPTPSSRIRLPSAAPRGVALFTSSVGSSALAMLRICGFVVFFTTLVGTLSHLFYAFSLSETLSALLFAIFEMTAGVSRGAACAPEVSRYLCAFAVGWSGLSVHFQMMSLCGDRPLSFSPYFFAKGAGAVMMVLLTMVFG